MSSLMTSIIRRFRASAVLLSALGLVSVACNRTKASGEKEQEGAKKDSVQSMADMPGMNPTSSGSDTTKPESRDDTKAGAGMLPSAITFSAAQAQHGGVRWGAVTMGTTSGSAVIPGEVVPNEDRTARLGAPVRGRVLTVPVRPGDRVAAGQALVTMQSPEAGAAQGDVAKAEAELLSRRAEAKYAASARARAERLLALKAIPRQDYDRATTDDEHARAMLTQAEAELRRARSTAEQLSASASPSGDLMIRAPFAGVVLARTALPGTVVEAGAPLVVMSDPASLWLSINAPEPLISLFHRGGALRFSVPAYPADTFKARVDAVAAELSPETRTLSVRALVTSGIERLKPQMLANVLVEGVGNTPAAFVPEDAVQLLGGKPNVFIAHADGKGGARFERREVVLGSRSAGRVAVLRGLSRGDVVVTTGAFAVKAELQKASMPKMEM